MRSRTILFVLCAVGVAALSLETLRTVVHLAWMDATASHILAVPLVSFALIYAERASVFATVKTELLSGAVIGAAGLAIVWASAGLADKSQAALTFGVAGIWLAGIGGFVGVYGWRATRAAAFPLLFLVFMLPPPTMVIGAVTSVLKRGSTEGVAALFSLTGTPYFRDGFTFALPELVIEIADECSGIRSSIALFLTSLLAGHQFFRTPWAKAILVIAILPVALLKNAIRIVSLSLLAIHVNPSFITGQLHQEGGVLFFLLALALLAPLFALLRWSETRQPNRVAAS